MWFASSIKSVISIGRHSSVMQHDKNFRYRSENFEAAFCNSTIFIRFPIRKIETLLLAPFLETILCLLVVERLTA